nr:unnamed protein product [Spirometra erinaceieuropaei]
MDYVLVQRRDQRDVHVTKTIPGAGGCTHHCVVISKMWAYLQLRRRPQDNLSVADAVDEDASVENRWCQLRATVHSKAAAVLCLSRCQHQDWLEDHNVTNSNLLAEKNRTYRDYVGRPTDDNRAAFYRSRRLVQQQLREMQDTWTDRKAEEIQGYADRNE